MLVKREVGCFGEEPAMVAPRARDDDDAATTCGLHGASPDGDTKLRVTALRLRSRAADPKAGRVKYAPDIATHVPRMSRPVERDNPVRSPKREHCSLTLVSLVGAAGHVYRATHWVASEAAMNANAALLPRAGS